MSKIKDFFYEEIIGLDMVLADEAEYWAEQDLKKIEAKKEKELEVA